MTNATDYHAFYKENQQGSKSQFELCFINQMFGVVLMMFYRSGSGQRSRAKLTVCVCMRECITLCSGEVVLYTRTSVLHV